MSSPRVRRIADRIKVVVAEMLERRLKDPRLGFVTVTDVRLTGDTQHATIFYTVLSQGSAEADDLAGTAVALESAKGMLRTEVGRQLGIRHVPSLEFVHDALPESARAIDDLLSRVAEADAEAAARSQGATYAGEPDPYRKPREDGDDEDDVDGDPDGSAEVDREDDERP